MAPRVQIKVSLGFPSFLNAFGENSLFYLFSTSTKLSAFLGLWPPHLYSKPTVAGQVPFKFQISPASSIITSLWTNSFASVFHLEGLLWLHWGFPGGPMQVISHFKFR